MWRSVGDLGPWKSEEEEAAELEEEGQPSGWREEAVRRPGQGNWCHWSQEAPDPGEGGMPAQAGLRESKEDLEPETR